MQCSGVKSLQALFFPGVHHFFSVSSDYFQTKGKGIESSASIFINIQGLLAGQSPFSWLLSENVGNVTQF